MLSVDDDVQLSLRQRLCEEAVPVNDVDDLAGLDRIIEVIGNVLPDAVVVGDRRSRQIPQLRFGEHGGAHLVRDLVDVDGARAVGVEADVFFLDGHDLGRGDRLILRVGDIEPHVVGGRRDESDELGAGKAPVLDCDWFTVDVDLDIVLGRHSGLLSTLPGCRHSPVQQLETGQRRNRPEHPERGARCQLAQSRHTVEPVSNWLGCLHKKHSVQVCSVLAVQPQ